MATAEMAATFIYDLFAHLISAVGILCISLFLHKNSHTSAHTHTHTNAKVIFYAFYSVINNTREKKSLNDSFRIEK